MALAFKVALLVAVSVSAATIGAARALANPSTLPLPPTESESEATPHKERVARARALFREGLSAARTRDWEGARLGFEQSYALVESAEVLFNLAGAQRRTGRLLASHANYRRVSQGKDASADLQRLAERLADEVEVAIPRLRVVIDGITTQDRVVLDRQRLYIDELGRDLWLDPGAHTIRIDRATGDAEVRTLTLSEKEVRVLSMRLR